MKKKIYPGCGEPQNRKRTSCSAIISATVFFLFSVLLINSCTKSVYNDEEIGDPLKTDFSAIVPSNLEDSVVVDQVVSVTYKEGTDPQLISSTAITLKSGTTVVPGTFSVTGTTAQFTPGADLSPESEYVATVLTRNSDEISGKKEYKWSFRTGKHHSYDLLSVLSVSPLNHSTAVSVDSALRVTFNKEITAAMKDFTSVTLKKGSEAVGGVVTFSGRTAIFKPNASLTSNALYTGNVYIGPMNITGIDNSTSGNSFTWSFTTGGGTADVTAPTINSAVPANNAVAVAVGASAIVTFSEAMNPATLTSSTFTLKQGTTAVAGSVSVTGATATFKPTSPLAVNKLYTGTITTGAKDAAGNPLAAAYVWSFTTESAADVTAPTVASVTPANNGTSVALDSKATATFSEAMNATSITTSTFTLKQGSTNIAGTVTYSGATATFTPSAALAGGTVYTATITMGAKDVAGNPIASNYTWSFTTVAVVTGKSFATDVVPILGICNTCHTHPWTTSTNASTFYTNLVSGGYVNAASPTTSKIYVKLSGGHPPGSTVTTAQVNTILTWMTEGSKNN
jgi:hypothetical protein